ncbi:eIF-2-alpha kinase GCN2-like protein [Drosera capensis]
MGQASKKKRKNKGRSATKDRSSNFADHSDLILEEFTALSAIFQEDCVIVSESPPRVGIKIRPYSKDTSYENMDVSAVLLVRCIPGYPFKAPKLQITSEGELSESDADKLLSVLNEQATFNAREGRAMIFNLVEAAQEFISEIAPQSQQPDNVPEFLGDINSQLSLQDISRFSDVADTSNEPFSYGFLDLFSGLGESWRWTFGRDSNSGKSSLSHSHLAPVSKHVYEGVERNFNQGRALTVVDKRTSKATNSRALGTLEEDSDNENKNLSHTDSSGPPQSFVECTAVSESDDEDTDLEDDNDDDKDEDGDESCDDTGESADASSYNPTALFQASDKSKTDLIMAHLLRLACGSNGALAEALPEITSELKNLGIISEEVSHLASEPASQYKRTFEDVFGNHMVTSRISQFWEAVPVLGEQKTPSLPSSRYMNDFEELRSLGHGGFGHVVLCKNKLDGRHYAVKMIRLKDERPPINDRILREVATLSRLQHHHVVRYYQAWFETGVVGSLNGSLWGSRSGLSTTFSNVGRSISGDGKEMLESTYLYIQMEYCPRTLRQLLESYNYFDKDLAWHLFRQIVEGLAHIHGQGIIHRDLTPNNIFFDARNDIKIGDFGLAKFLKLEQLDQDPAFTSDAPGISTDGTGQIGTYFYTAPEIEQGWPKIDEKADMYSLGVVFFELWHPFGTAMERHIILSDLKMQGKLPSGWVAEFPEQATLLRRLMSQSPSERPSATELLQHAFPPRMEYELLDKFLRTMQNSEDSSVYDKVVSAIFDEETLSSKSSNHHSGRLKLATEDSSPLQFSEIGTRIRDHVVDLTKEVFKQHCGKHLEIIPMHLLGDSPQFDRNTLKILSDGGDMIELIHELRSTFVRWIVANQKTSYKRYEVSSVYRRAVGHSSPNRYLQGDFDIIGGTSGLIEAEVIKVTVDIMAHFFQPDSCDIHINHGKLLDAIWSWAGIRSENRYKVAELLSLLSSLHPQSSERKSKWVVIRHQLLQELGLAEAVVDRLQTVSLRFCGDANQTLPRLRGALPADESTRKAIDELSDLLSYLRVWKIEKHVFIDALMPPTESYHRDIFFQLYYVQKRLSSFSILKLASFHGEDLLEKGGHGSAPDGTLLAIGGRYDYLLHKKWELEHKSSPPAAVGTSLALETIVHLASLDIRPFRSETKVPILICSKGGGGLLAERMELAAELWSSSINAEFVPSSDPSLTEQYEYANEHDIKCLVILTDSVVSQDSVKVRHLDQLKKEKEVVRGDLVRFLADAIASQFRNPAIWN